MPITCFVCNKEAKSEFGLSVHMRTHKEKTEVAQKEAPKPVVDSKPVVENFTEISRSGEFALAVNGKEAIITDLNGKRLSPVMGLDKAAAMMARMATARR